ncbi:hypothetical protein [Thermorudis peleae]|uniref:hypothetical protein n=1 Tax=Thermorudis peleae TaxID=1382356 RepID=UPI00056E2AED|nr:hypothetical protein [Thermorudis peleae]
MKRQVLTDGTGRWFDREKATRFDEAREWDGRNWVSKATGSQWDHEELYRTKSGRWIRHWWSQWQGSTDRWEEVTEAEAVRWLLQNDYEPDGGDTGCHQVPDDERVTSLVLGLEV